MTISHSESLINTERMTREVTCPNIDHETLTFITNEIRPKCPICEGEMVRVVKSVLTGVAHNTPRGKHELVR